MPHWESKQMKKSICLRILCSVVLCSVDAQRLGINVNNHCVTFLKRFAPIMVFLNVGICEVRSAPELLPAPWNEKVKYEILQASSSGIIPKPGDLVGVRFKGAYKGVVFEDIFNSEEPYIYRCIHKNKLISNCYVPNIYI